MVVLHKFARSPTRCQSSPPRNWYAKPLCYYFGMSFESMPKALQSPPDKGSASPEVSPSLDTLSRQEMLECSKKIFALSKKGTGNDSYNWVHAMSYPVVCRFILDSLKDGLPPAHIENMLIGKKANILHIDLRSIRGTLENTAAEWERRTSLSGVSPEGIHEVMRNRVLRCYDGSGRGVSWGIFFAEPENRRYVIERLESLLGNPPLSTGEQMKKLRGLSIEISKRKPGDLKSVFIAAKKLRKGAEIANKTQVEVYDEGSAGSTGLMAISHLESSPKGSLVKLLNVLKNMQK